MSDFPKEVQEKVQQRLNHNWFFFYFLFFLLFTRIRIPYDICDNRSITHYQHWSIIILINILITPFQTSYALWLAKTDLFTVIPILRYCQRLASTIPQYFCHVLPFWYLWFFQNNSQSILWSYCFWLHSIMRFPTFYRHLSLKIIL